MNLNGSRQSLYTPLPVMTMPVPAAFTRSTSTPFFNSETVHTSVTATQMPPPLQTPSQGTVHARSTDCLSGNPGQPLFDLKNHSFEPVRTAHSIRSSAVIGDRLDREDRQSHRTADFSSHRSFYHDCSVCAQLSSSITAYSTCSSC